MRVVLTRRFSQPADSSDPVQQARAIARTAKKVLTEMGVRGLEVKAYMDADSEDAVTYVSFDMPDERVSANHSDMPSTTGRYPDMQ